MYQAAIDADEKSEKMKVSVFSHVVGDEALQVYNKFAFDADADKMKPGEMIEKFDAYCIPERNVTFERHRFFMCTENGRDN